MHMQIDALTPVSFVHSLWFASGSKHGNLNVTEGKVREFNCLYLLTNFIFSDKLTII